MDIDTFESICASHGDPIAVWEPETHPLRGSGRYPFCSAPDPVKIAVWKIDDKYEGGILVGCTWHEGPPHQWHVNAGHRQAIAHLMGLIAAVEAERDSLRADLADARQCLSMFTDDPRAELERIKAAPVVDTLPNPSCSANGMRHAAEATQWADSLLAALAQPKQGKEGGEA